MDRDRGVRGHEALAAVILDYLDGVETDAAA
jgi:hypothetical protein